jgi:DNA-binding GntR family transcriptional regulator
VNATGQHEPQVRLDRNAGVPLHQQISRHIEALIRSGELPAGTRIEKEVAMAARLGVSRPTARQALQDLVDRGLLVRTRGVGTQVTPELIRRPVGLTSLFDDLTTAGRDPRTQVLGYDVVPAEGTVAERLGLPEGTPVVAMQRLRTTDGEPLAILTNHLPAAIAPSREELEVMGLYGALRAKGVQVRVARQSIGARLATTAEARMLDERPRSALLTMERVTVDVSNTVVEFGSHVYRASRYSFDTTLFAD